ncbi:MAG: hypothetical protein AB7K24_11455 [Gemmataceae bacterium]
MNRSKLLGAILIVMLVAVAARSDEKLKRQFTNLAEDFYEDLVRDKTATLENCKLDVPFLPEVECPVIKFHVSEARRRQLTLPMIVVHDSKGAVIAFLWAKEATLSTDQEKKQLLLHMRDAHFVAVDHTARLHCAERVFSITVVGDGVAPIRK